MQMISFAVVNMFIYLNKMKNSKFGYFVILYEVEKSVLGVSKLQVFQNSISNIIENVDMKIHQIYNKLLKKALKKHVIVKVKN